MGAESSTLLNCELGEPIVTKTEWSLHPALTADDTQVSVFVYKNSTPDTELVENATKFLKVLRHPCIVRFLGWTQAGDAHELITEKIVPLQSVVESLTSLEIFAGLYDIIQALSFLNETGNFCHNNVNISSIFISEDGTWKLGCMEHLCRHQDLTLEKLKKAAVHKDPVYISPDVKNGTSFQYGSELGHSIDVYAFGVLVQQLLDTVEDDLENEDITPHYDDVLHEKLLSDNPRGRPRFSSLLNESMFRNDFQEIIAFLKNITLKSESEKKHFFGTVVEKLRKLPAELVARRLTRPLLSRFVLLEPATEEDLLPYILRPRKDNSEVDGNVPIIPKALFQKYVLPEVFKIFHVREFHVRLAMLRQFPYYVKMFDKGLLETVILPQVIVGLKDDKEELVAESFHALAELVLILGCETVIGSNSHRIFKEGKPKIVDKARKLLTNGATRAVRNKDGDMHNGAIQNANNGGEQNVLKDEAKQLQRQKKREEFRMRMEERKKKKVPTAALR